MELTDRQERILDIVKSSEPITGAQIAKKLDLSRSTLRSDFSVLTMQKLLISKPKVGYFYNTNRMEPLVVQQLSRKYVEKVMTNPTFIRQDESVQEGVAELFLEDIGSLYVLNEEKQLVGVVSRKDLLKIALGNSNIDEVPISMAMTRVPNVYYIFSDDTVEYATQKLLAHKIDSLPVMDREEWEKNNHLVVVGKFSKTTISQLFLSVLENEI